jgi:tRNA(Ile2) C34 agmatinyltransferase TiaS
MFTLKVVLVCVILVIVLAIVISSFMPERCDTCKVRLTFLGYGVHGEGHYQCPKCGYECQEDHW